MQSSDFSDVFVSYRRKDVEFAKKVVEALREAGKEVWIDWEDIPPGSEGFSDDIKRGLEGTDAFICILSPDYMVSTYCVDMELGYAINLNKKIIPIVLHKFDEHFEKLPDKVKGINWIYFTPHAGHQNTFEESLQRVLQALEQDLDHARIHRRMALRALQWVENDRKYSYLLDGAEVDEAENWLQHAFDKIPEPTELHVEFITASRKLERLNQQRLLAGVSIALIVAIMLSVLSFFLWRQSQQNLELANAARHESQISLSLLLSQQARELYEAGDPVAAIAMALTAANIEGAPLFSRSALPEVAYAPGVRARFDEHEDEILRVAYSSDKSTVAASSKDIETGEGRVIVWNPQTGDVITTVAHSGWVWGLSYHPDGNRIFSAADEGELWLWDITTGEIIQTFEGHEGQIRDIEVSSGGSLMVSGGEDTRAIVWDTETGEIVLQLDEPDSTVDSVAFSQDDTLLAVSSRDKLIRLYDMESGELLKTFTWESANITALAFSPDATELYSGTSSDETIIVWDIETGEIIRSFSAGRSGSWGMDFSDDGTFAITGATKPEINVWNLQTGELVDTYIAHQQTVWAVDISADGSRVLTGSADTDMIEWDVTPGNIVREFTPHEAPAISTTLTQDGTLGASSDENNEIIIWEIESGDIVHRLSGHTGGVFRVKFDSTGETLFSAGGDGILLRWDVKTGEILTSYEGHSGAIFDMALSPDERTLVSASQDGRLVLFDVESGEPIRDFVGTENRVLSVDFHPSGRYIISSTNDVLTLWDVETGETVRRFEGHETLSVVRVRFHPSGDYALSVTSSTVPEVILWDVNTGEEIRRFSGHEDRLWDIAFMPDGGQVFTAGFDGTMRAWDVTTGDLLHLMYHPGQIRGIALNGDGSMALSSGQNGTVVLSHFRGYDELVKWTYDNRVVRDLTCQERLLYRLQPPCDESGVFPTSTPFVTTIPDTATPMTETAVPDVEASTTPIPPTWTPTNTPTPTETSTVTASPSPSAKDED